MRKLFLTLAVAVSSLAASAQVFVGGEVGFWRNSDANTTDFTIHPEVGYTLSNKWALGIGFGYTHAYSHSDLDDIESFVNLAEDKELGHATSGRKTNTVTIDPYARWSFANVGPVTFFLDMGFGIETYKYKFDYEYRTFNDGKFVTEEDTYKSDSFTGWYVGVRPGVKVAVAKNLDFVAHLGFLGYRDADDNYAGSINKGFGFHASSKDLNFGLYYNF